jgi:hypothetical protein
MNNIIYLQDQKDWFEVSLMKKELAFHKSRNRKGIFDEAIKKEEEFIRSFRKRAVPNQAEAA